MSVKWFNLSRKSLDPNVESFTFFLSLSARSSTLSTSIAIILTLAMIIKVNYLFIYKGNSRNSL